jgi:hypothetical protein
MDIPFSKVAVAGREYGADRIGLDRQALVPGA